MVVIVVAVVAVDKLWLDTVPEVDEVLDCDNLTVLELPIELPKLLGFTLVAVCDGVDIDTCAVLEADPVVELDVGM